MPLLWMCVSVCRSVGDVGVITLSSHLTCGSVSRAIKTITSRIHLVIIQGSKVTFEKNVHSWFAEINYSCHVLKNKLRFKYAHSEKKKKDVMLLLKSIFILTKQGRRLMVYRCFALG